MKKEIFKILLFLLVIYIIDKPIAYIISNGIQGYQQDRRIKLLLEGELNPDILILGSSRSLGGIDARLMEESVDQKVFNFSFSGSNINFHKDLLSLSSNFIHPKCIILNLDGQSTFSRTDAAIYRKDKLYPFIEYNEVLELITSVSNKNYYLSRVLNCYRQNQNMINSISYYSGNKEVEDITNSIDDNGSCLIDSQLNNFGKKNVDKVYNTLLEDANCLESIFWIKNYCKSNNIKLYLLNLPNYNSVTEGFKDRINTLMENQVEFIDLSALEVPKEFFYDESHLNIKGAKFVTEQIIPSLQ